MSFNIQQQIKNNASEIREYIHGLHEWEQQKETEENIRKQQKLKQPPVEVKAQKAPQAAPAPTPESNEEFKKLKRDVNTVSSYYKAWDKFDVDAEIQSIEKAQKIAHKPYNPYENSANNIRAKPKAQMTIKGGREVVRDPTSLKDRGNLHFKACEYQKAIECYRQCLEKAEKQPDSKNIQQLKCIVLSNRAMAYLKLGQFKLAYEDCCISIDLDSKYMKSYLRRATALRKLKRYKESLTDYRKVLELDPTSVEAKDQLKRIESYLQSKIKEARQSLVKEGNVSTLQTYRLEIQEVDELQNQKPLPTNYLEEL